MSFRDTRWVAILIGCTGQVGTAASQRAARFALSIFLRLNNLFPLRRLFPTLPAPLS